MHGDNAQSCLCQQMRLLLEVCYSCFLSVDFTRCTKLDMMYSSFFDVDMLFCRHHTNPVGTEWKWKMDDPDLIVDAAMANHYNMIKQFRGKTMKLLLNICATQYSHPCGLFYWNDLLWFISYYFIIFHFILFYHIISFYLIFKAGANVFLLHDITYFTNLIFLQSQE